MLIHHYKHPQSGDLIYSRITKYSSKNVHSEDQPLPTHKD